MIRWAALLIVALAALGAARPVPPLRVCADPNNLPFSNNKEEGFENRLAELLATDLHRRLEYTWWPQRRGFVRNTIGAGRCDLIVGVPAHYDLVLTSRPYYRSTYVFVSRRSRHLGVRSFDDPRLATLRIGVQLVGDDFANTPPAHALSARRLIGNIVGYSVYGNYSEPNPPARIVEAVAAGDIDLAVVWGPLAGFFAQRAAVPLELHPVTETRRLTPDIPFAFAIAMGVRRGDDALKARLDEFIERRQADINALLARYGVPLSPAEERS
jgi:quinoprotein dehydrogenase-associated probable ABC transporter substrate-binding protein